MHPIKTTQAFALRPGEIIVDMFAGGGGASSAIKMALGREPDIAVNHDPEAIAMHEVNHPHTRHYIEDVWQVDPVEACAGRPVGLAWFSPSCTHFSRARGGKPVSKQLRGLAWVVVNWAKAVKPRLIFVENVIEFQTWGSLLDDGSPDLKRKGETFRLWWQALEDLGYVLDKRHIRACDHGAPTTRERLFIVARCDGEPIEFPEPDHGPGRPHAYRTAAECIDWTIPCPSIFDRKKPLAENTLKRIARGLKRYVLDAKDPFIVNGVAPYLAPLTHHGDSRTTGPNEPLPTITCANRGEQALITPYLARLAQTGGNGKYANDVLEPVTTITTKAEHLLIAPTLVQVGYGERKGQQPRSLDIQQPLGTVVAGGNKHALVTAFVAKHFGDRGQQPGSELDKPLSTVTAVDHNSLVAVHLQRDFGKSTGSAMGEPEGSITAGGSGKQALVASHLVKLRGGLEDHVNTAQDVREPLPSITAGGTHIAEVRAFLVKYFSTHQDPRLDEPLHTITTKDRFGLVTVVINGETYAIVDIGMRMLTPRELFTAQGFKRTYVIDRTRDGKKLTKTAQVRMCGNSVSPYPACALIQANTRVRDYGLVAA